jgi:hypothetical protein
MTVFLICMCLIIAACILLFFRDDYVQMKLRRITWEKYALMRTVIERLESHKPLDENDLLTLAKNFSLRTALFRTLQLYHQLERFPLAFFTEEKAAEGYMVEWLEFPTELGRAPDEIFLLKIVAIENEVQSHYYVFRFRTSAPKWASKLKWMLGVCGPYNDSSKPFDVPRKVFSRFNSVDSIQPDAEAQWVHENISG